MPVDPAEHTFLRDPVHESRRTSVGEPVEHMEGAVARGGRGGLCRERGGREEGREGEQMAWDHGKEDATGDRVLRPVSSERSAGPAGSLADSGGLMAEG